MLVPPSHEVARSFLQRLFYVFPSAYTILRIGFS